MSRSISLVLAMLVLATVSQCVSEALADEPTNIYVVDDKTDEVLHDKCAFLGADVVAKRILPLKDGEVAILLGGFSNGTTVVKRFACLDKPPFYKGAWKSASCAAFPDKEKVRCEAKLLRVKVSPPPAPPVTLLPPPAPAVIVSPPPAPPNIVSPAPVHEARPPSPTTKAKRVSGAGY